MLRRYHTREEATRRRGISVGTHLLQFVQRTLSDTAFFEIILGRIHNLLDDLLVDVALFPQALAIAVSCALARRLDVQTYHQRVRHCRGG